MKNLNVEVFKKDGFSYEEIEDIRISEEEQKLGKTYSLDEAFGIIKKNIFTKDLSKCIK